MHIIFERETAILFSSFLAPSLPMLPRAPSRSSVLQLSNHPDKDTAHSCPLLWALVISAYHRRKNKGSNNFLDQKFPKDMTHKINGVTLASCGTPTLIKRTLLFCRPVCASFPLRPRGSCSKDSLISWQSAAEVYMNALMELAATEY